MSITDSTSVPHGYCLCGCGERTPIATRNDRTTKRVKGKPMLYVRGHNTRKRRKNTGEDYYRRFSVVDTGYETPCWLWSQGLDYKGYAHVKHDGKSRSVHGLHYEFKYGSIPDGLVPDHLCRQRSCVNPDHIEPVTNAENSRRGDNTKLTVDQVREIRRLYATGQYNQHALGRMFGVSNYNIYIIVHRKGWKDVW